MELFALSARLLVLTVVSILGLLSISPPENTPTLLRHVLEQTSSRFRSLLDGYRVVQASVQSASPVEGRLETAVTEAAYWYTDTVRHDICPGLYSRLPVVDPPPPNLASQIAAITTVSFQAPSEMSTSGDDWMQERWILLVLISVLSTCVFISGLFFVLSRTSRLQASSSESSSPLAYALMRYRTDGQDAGDEENSGSVVPSAPSDHVQDGLTALIRIRVVSRGRPRSDDMDEGGSHAPQVFQPVVRSLHSVVIEYLNEIGVMNGIFNIDDETALRMCTSDGQLPDYNLRHLRTAVGFTFRWLVSRPGLRQGRRVTTGYEAPRNLPTIREENEPAEEEETRSESTDSDVDEADVSDEDLNAPVICIDDYEYSVMGTVSSPVLSYSPNLGSISAMVASSTGVDVPEVSEETGDMTVEVEMGNSHRRSLSADHARSMVHPSAELLGLLERLGRSEAGPSPAGDSRSSSALVSGSLNPAVRTLLASGDSASVGNDTVDSGTSRGIASPAMANTVTAARQGADTLPEHGPVARRTPTLNATFSFSGLDRITASLASPPGAFHPTDELRRLTAVYEAGGLSDETFDDGLFAQGDNTSGIEDIRNVVPLHLPRPPLPVYQPPSAPFGPIARQVHVMPHSRRDPSRQPLHVSRAEAQPSRLFASTAEFSGNYSSVGASNANTMGLPAFVQGDETRGEERGSTRAARPSTHTLNAAVVRRVDDPNRITLDHAEGVDRQFVSGGAAHRYPVETHKAGKWEGDTRKL